MKRGHLPLTGILLMILASNAAAVEHTCKVTQKFDSESVYSDEHLRKYKDTVVIREEGTSASLGRCSHSPSAGKETCDIYNVDHVAFDTNAKIKKFYVFRSQFDVQLFHNMTFVENNGRGGIAFGTCSVSSP